MEVARGIHRIEAPLGDRFVCMYVLAGDDAVLLIDTGLKGMPTEHVAPYLKKLGCAWDDVRYVLTSHIDFDHTGGNAEVRGLASGAAFMCHELDRPMIEDVERMIAGRYSAYAPDHAIDEPEETKQVIRDSSGHTPVDVSLRGGERLRLSSDWSVEVWHLPGHSAGQVGVWDDRSRSLIVTDAVLGDAVLTADGAPAFPPTYCLPAPYRATAQRVIDAKPARVLTSHYPVYEGSEGIAFAQLSADYADRVERTMREYLASQSGGRTLKQIIADTWKSLGEWPDGGYLSWPMHGHLQEMVTRGVVTRERVGEAYAFAWAGD